MKTPLANPSLIVKPTRKKNFMAMVSSDFTDLDTPTMWNVDTQLSDYLCSSAFTAGDDI